MEQALAAATGVVEAVFCRDGGRSEGVGVEPADLGIAAGYKLEEVETARKSDDVADAIVKRSTAVGEVHAVGVDHRERVVPVGLYAVEGVGRIQVVMKHPGVV